MAAPILSAYTLPREMAMSLHTQSDVKYASSELMAGITDCGTLRVEHRHVPAGAYNPVTSSCTELVIILSGRGTVRRTGNGQRQERVALPGTSWLVPAGTHETQLELDAPLECLHLFMPSSLLERSALADYDIDPGRTRLAYAPAVADPVMAHIGGTLQAFMRGGNDDRLFCDGIRTAVAARLMGHYTVERRSAPPPAPKLDHRRLKRVLDFVQTHLADDLTLDALARQAFLSPFHFARLFREALGVPPHRYVSERRVEAAKAMLAADGASLAQIALATGFGSQANFTRVFGKAAGMTPGQHRAQCRNRRVVVG